MAGRKRIKPRSEDSQASIPTLMEALTMNASNAIHSATRALSHANQGIPGFPPLNKIPRNAHDNVRRQDRFTLVPVPQRSHAHFGEFCSVAEIQEFLGWRATKPWSRYGSHCWHSSSAPPLG